jgi:hypothetical protein
MPVGGNEALSSGQASECSGTESVSEWLQIAVPIYWEHHSYVSYPPEIDWANSHWLRQWAERQDPREMVTQRYRFEAFAAELSAYDLSKTQFIGNAFLQSALRTTAAILDELLDSTASDDTKLSDLIDDLGWQVAETDLAISEWSKRCLSEQQSAGLAEELACFYAMEAFHGDWARAYGGYKIYFSAVAFEAEDALVQGDASVARERAADIRQAATDMSAEFAPIPVKTLVEATVGLSLAYADWFDGRADLLDGRVSEDKVTELESHVRSAFAAEESAASDVFQPCEEVETQLIVPAASFSPSTDGPLPADSQLNESECANASQWFGESMSGIADGNVLSERLLSNLQIVIEAEDLRFLDLEDYDAMASDFEELERAQRQLVTPPLAVSANEMLASRYQHLSNAATYLGADGSTLESLASATREVSLATDLGTTVVPLMSIVVEKCALAIEPALAPALACFTTVEVRASDWYMATNERLVAFTQLENEYWQQVDNGTPDQASVAWMEVMASRLSSELGEIQLPASSSGYVLAVLAYVDAAVALITSYQTSDSPADYSLELGEYERAYESLVLAEQEILSGCDALSMSVE